MLTATFIIILVANVSMIASLLWYKMHPRHSREYPLELVALVSVNISYISWLGSNSSILMTHYNTNTFTEQIINLCASICSHELIYTVLNLAIVICIFLYIFMILLIVTDAFKTNKASILLREAMHLLSTGTGIIAICLIVFYV